MFVKATGIKLSPGSIPQGLKTAFNKSKISSNFGPKRVGDVLRDKNNRNIDQGTLKKIFEKIDEKGVLKTSWAGSPEKFTREVEKQQRIDDRQAKVAAQNEQKNSAANKPVAAQNQGVKKSLPINDKQAKQIQKEQKVKNIGDARRKTLEAERWRGVVLGGKIGQVIEEQNKFRKTWGKSAELTVKSGGGGWMAAEGRSGGLVGHAVKEEENDEKNSSKGSKSGQKDGGNAPAGQKSGGSPEAKLARSGQQVVKLQGFIGEKLTHRQEISKNENLPGGVIHVEGLDEAPASPPESSSAPRSASALEDITDLDIG